MKQDYIYVPFNKSVKNYIEEAESFSKNLFSVNIDVSSDKKSLSINGEEDNLVSIMINPVYIIIKRISNSDLAGEIYNAITLNAKKFCN